jgi:hypothetical protein
MSTKEKGRFAKASFPLAIFFARSEFIPLSLPLDNLFQMVAAESSKTIAKCRFARKKLQWKAGFSEFN